MKKLFSLIIVILTILLSNPVNALWVSDEIKSDLNVNVTLQTGNWPSSFMQSTIVDVAANPGPYPKGTIYYYNKDLFIITVDNFNSKWHQLDAVWATASLELKWESGYNYLPSSIIRHKGKYYKANDKLGSNYYAHDPEKTQNWTAKPWLRIERMSDKMFNKIDGTNITNYSDPISKYIKYI